MSEKPRRFAALYQPCPKCGAQAGFACKGKRDQIRVSPHQARLKGLTKRMIAQGAKAQSRSRKGKATGFYVSDAWRALRYRALRQAGGCCQCCGCRGSRISPLHVDHIKPRSRFPELELELSNLQVLCEDCNLGKGAWDQTDWRPGTAGLQ